MRNDRTVESSDEFDATVVIVSKNRKDELRGAVESALAQQGRVEVLVFDDASTDGTAEMIRRDFPSVRLERVEQSCGYIVHRNRGARMASSPVIFSIDDDAAFSSPQVVVQTLAEFDHPRVGAVSIPSIDVNKKGQPYFHVLKQDGVWAVEAFRGTAYAVRRDLFLKLGGFKETYFHQGEENEYCLRLLDAGYITRIGASDPIHHFESPNRDRSRIFLYSARNNVLFTWYDVPLPQFLVHLPGTIAIVLKRGAKHGYIGAVVKGIAMGLGTIAKEFRKRHPVRRSVYRLSRQLRKGGPARVETIEDRLPEAIS